MDITKDYYAILGLHPKADDAVIRAAYKHLAQRYHPDRNDSVDATKIFQEIREAYSILSDKDKRQSYDESRGIGPQETTTDFGGEGGNSGISDDPLYRDWGKICELYPELEVCVGYLDKIAFRLGYAYRAVLLELKDYKRGREIATLMKREFLGTYFGSDERIIEYAEYLIFLDQKEAAKDLNNWIRILGTTPDDEAIHKIIGSIGKKFNIDRSHLSLWKDFHEARARIEKVKSARPSDWGQPLDFSDETLREFSRYKKR